MLDALPLHKRALVLVLEVVCAILNWRPRERLLQWSLTTMYRIRDQASPPVSRYDRPERDRWQPRRDRS